MLSKGHQSRWYFNHCDCLGPCSTTVPGSKKTAFDHQQANFGKQKRWMSSGSKHASRNMRPSLYAGKQAHWGDKRVWWFVVLAKGRVHLAIMPDCWRQNGEGRHTWSAGCIASSEACWGQLARCQMFSLQTGAWLLSSINWCHLS